MYAASASGVRRAVYAPLFTQRCFSRVPQMGISLSPCAKTWQSLCRIDQPWQPQQTGNTGFLWRLSVFVRWKVKACELEVDYYR